MGFRFRKRLRIIPGLWLNLSKKGTSLSVGGRGATINVNRQGVQETYRFQARASAIGLAGESSVRRPLLRTLRVNP